MVESVEGALLWGVLEDGVHVPCASMLGPSLPWPPDEGLCESSLHPAVETGDLRPHPQASGELSRELLQYLLRLLPTSQENPDFSPTGMFLGCLLTSPMQGGCAHIGDQVTQDS